jgi:hypothetical protein
MTFERDLRGPGGDFSNDGLTGGSPGKRSRSENLPVQRKAADSPVMTGLGSSDVTGEVADPFAVHLDADDRPVQRKITAPQVLQKKDGDVAEQPGAAAAGKDAPVAKLHMFVDIDVKSLGIKDLTSGRVGHTWIALEYIDTAAVPDAVPGEHKALLQAGGKYADPMGFWPDTQNGVYYNPNPFKSWVDGWMRHPDRAHEGSEKAVQTWAITQAEVDAVIAYAESKRGAKYSVYFFNCTTFGAEAVKAAGKSPPSHSTAGICFPNAAYDGIKANQAKGRGNTEVHDLDTGNVTTANGPDGKAG